MTDFVDKLAQATTIHEAFRALADADNDLIVLHVTSGSTVGEIWVNRSRRLFYVKSKGDAGNGMLALMMLLAVKEAKFSADTEQPIAHKPNIDEPIFVGELVADLPDVVQRVKNILWPVAASESDIMTEAGEALPAEMLQQIMFQAPSSGFFEPKLDDVLEEMTADVEDEVAQPVPAPPVIEQPVEAVAPDQPSLPEPEPEPEPTPADEVPMLISEDELAGYSMLGEPQDFSPPKEESKPTVQHLEKTLQLPPDEVAQIQKPLPAPPLEPKAPVDAPLSTQQSAELQPALEPELQLEAQPEPTVNGDDRGFTLADLNAIKTPQASSADSVPMLSSNAEAETLPAPEAEHTQPPQAPPLSSSGRYVAPVIAPAPPTKKFPLGAITTIAAAVVIVGAIGFTVFSGITNGATGKAEDTQTTNDFVQDTIQLKQLPPVSK